MGAVGKADPMVAAKIRAVFEQRCVEMLQWACVTLKGEKHINADWDEENITANLYELIRTSSLSVEYGIYLEYDHSFFGPEILDNKKKANSAARVDLAFQYGWTGPRFWFFVEAKNLIERDVQKTGRKTKMRAATVIERYIETGIDHYLNKHYPLGCLLGYVLNGTIDSVVKAINMRLAKKMRNSETLSLPLGTLPWMVSQSRHTDKANQEVQIVHYLFDFGSRVN